MKLDDLKQDWQQTVKAPPLTADFKEVISVLEKETSKIDKEIKRRDILEISIAMLLIPVWVFGLVNSVSLIQTLGCWFAIATSLFVSYKLLRAKRVEAPRDASVKAFLETEKQKVQQQKQLLESIVWWYIAPITLSIVLITLGANVDSSGMPQITDFILKYYGALALLVVGGYLLNKRAARKKFGPLLTNIEQRLAELNQE